MKDPVDAFIATVVQLKPGDVHVYHVGHLGADISSSPTLSRIAMFTHGLHLMGRIGLRQERKVQRVETNGSFFDHPFTKYSFKVLAPILPVDFDTARKVHLDSLV